MVAVLGFPPIIAVGENAALPHAIPGKTKLKKNGMLLVDWGSIYNDLHFRYDAYAVDW